MLKVGKMLAVKLAGPLTQAELLALRALRKPGRISRSHSPDEQAPLAFAFQPSAIYLLPSSLSAAGMRAEIKIIGSGGI